MDRSSGYESISAEFLARRGREPSVGVGVKEVRDWARSLAPGSAVIDVGCGPGFPITSVLVEERLNVFAIDASPTFVAAFQRNLPGTPVLCEAVQDGSFFNRTFDAALSWGLMFLLTPEDQHRLIHRFAEILLPGGRLLFTSPDKPHEWNDAMTGKPSVSLCAEQYQNLLTSAGLSLLNEYDDVGGNHYFDVIKPTTR